MVRLRCGQRRLLVAAAAPVPLVMGERGLLARDKHVLDIRLLILNALPVAPSGGQTTGGR